jgi:2-phosphoglycerate kinase
VSRIYLLGGTSQAGKSRCATKIADQFGLEPLDVDAIRVPLQRAAAPDDPIRYFFGCGWLVDSPENSLAHKIDVARRTCEAGVAGAIDRLLSAERDVILEGDDLLPEFVAGWLATGATGAAFLVETDLNVVRRRFLERDQTDCIRGDPERLERFLPHYLGWTNWLRDEATRRNLAVIDARGGDPCDDVAAALDVRSQS